MFIDLRCQQKSQSLLSLEQDVIVIEQIIQIIF